MIILSLVVSAFAATYLTECQVAGYLRQHGFPETDVPKLTCASYYESTRNCNAQGPENADGTYDFGILQVNSNYWCSGAPGPHSSTGCGLSCASVIASCDAGFACAKIVYNAQGVDAWYGYTGHKSTCDSYELPSSCPSSSPGPVVPSQPSGQVACTFNQVAGVCSQQTDCQAATKMWTSSNAGASGCENEPDDVECCTNPGTVISGGSSSSGDDSSSGGGNPPCTYRSAPGYCVSSCSGGQFRSSHQGAHGCESYAAAIKCCIASSNLVDDIYSGYQSSSGATGVPLALIVGVVIGVVLLIAILVGVAVYFFVFRRRDGAHSDIMYSNPTFSTVVEK